MEAVGQKQRTIRQLEDMHGRQVIGNVRIPFREQSIDSVADADRLVSRDFSNIEFQRFCPSSMAAKANGSLGIIPERLACLAMPSHEGDTATSHQGFEAKTADAWGVG